MAAMTMSHFTLWDFWKFIDERQDEIHARFLLHHLAVCPECYETAGFILDRYQAGDIPHAFVATTHLGWRTSLRVVPGMSRDIDAARGWGAK
jgi:hypothetical protein